MTSLHSFGFNGFGQTTPNSDRVSFQTLVIRRVLLATWETTIVETIEGVIQVWGYEPPQLALWKDKQISSIFGDPNTLMGVVDGQGNVWCADARNTVPKKLTSDAKQAAYAVTRREIYVLYNSGDLQCFTRFGADDILEFTSEKLSVPPVYSLSASHTHALFYTAGMDPVYGRGSNRFSQLGQTIDQDSCAAIEFFGGLGIDRQDGMVACGLFHSAVVLAGDLYTFGWRKSGQLGWGVQEEYGIIEMPVFLNEDDQEEEDVYIVKIACGAEHTVAIDDQGRVWTCGSNKYGQLGRTTKEMDHDPYFRLCIAYSGKAVDCYAGRWNTFILSTTEKKV